MKLAVGVGWLTPNPSGGFMRAVVSKRGVDDGNQKGGGFLQPAKESQNNYSAIKTKRKRYFQNIFFGKIPQTLP
jgi:hypothetical protein